MNKFVGRPQIKRKNEADELATFKISSSVKCFKCDLGVIIREHAIEELSLIYKLSFLFNKIVMLK